jgi:hypothetical protein
MYLFIVCITESIFGWNEWCDASSCHLFELEKMMFRQEGTRIGRPPASKKRRQIGFGGGLVCPSCCRRRVDGVCGCAGNAARAVVANEEERDMLHAMFDVDDDEVIMCVDEAGMPLSEEDHNEDRLDEEMEEDLEVEMMEGDVHGVLAVHDGVGGFVELLPEKCRNCCRKKNSMVEDTEPYCLQLALYKCTGIQMRLRFCSFRQCDVQNEAEIVLCSECASFLVHGEKQDMKNVWPAFLWSVLRNDVIAGHCGIGVWSYIPMKW